MSDLPSPPKPSMSRWAQTRGMSRDPFQLVAACRAECGDVFRLSPLGLPPMVVVCSPEALGELFKMPETHVVTGEVRGKVFGHVVGDDFSLWLDGEEYFERRRAMLPYVTGQRLLSELGVIRRIIQQEIRTWPEGETFSLLPRADRISRLVIQRVIFGPQLAPDLDELCRRYLEACKSPWIYIRWLNVDLGPWSPWGKLVRARDALEARLDDEVRRLVSASGLYRIEKGGGVEYDDLVCSLIDHLGAAGEAERQSVVHEVMAFLIGGAETTSKMIVWTLLDLVERPRILERIRAELNEVVGEGEIESEHLRRLPFLHAVVEEGLRFRAPGPTAGPRLAKRDIELGGFRIPAGSQIVQALSESGRNEHFPSPDTFDPESNFEGRDVSEPHHYPFGGGVRRCTGHALARLELSLALAEIVRHFDLERVGEGDAPEKDGIAFSPPGGLEVRLRRRDGAGGVAAAVSGDAA